MGCVPHCLVFIEPLILTLGLKNWALLARPVDVVRSAWVEIYNGREKIKPSKTAVE